MSGLSISSGLSVNSRMAMAGMSKSLGAQKLGASLIERTLEKSNEMRTQLSNNRAGFSNSSLKGNNIDIIA